MCVLLIYNSSERLTQLKALLYPAYLVKVPYINKVNDCRVLFKFCFTGFVIQARIYSVRKILTWQNCVLLSQQEIWAGTLLSRSKYITCVNKSSSTTPSLIKSDRFIMC